MILSLSMPSLFPPCVLRNVPVVEREDEEMAGLRAQDSLIFGNLHDRSLAEIWREKSYKAFRQDHSKGRVPRSCQGCAKLFSVAHG